jgi:hypothetical protein
MATLDIPGDLYVQLQADAEAKGTTVDELALDTLWESLRGKRWQAMFSINKHPEMSDGEVVDAVHDYRSVW